MPFFFSSSSLCPLLLSLLLLFALCESASVSANSLPSSSLLDDNADDPSSHSPWFTILHVTDVHGWVYGHRHNETLNTDFGDFTDLILHLRALAFQNQEEFFVFDTGDLIEGTGLSDATPIHGVDILKVIEALHNFTYYDGLTMGNHDVEHPDGVQVFDQAFIPSWGGYYLTANILYQNDGFIGSPYAVLKTRFGYRMLLLGYLYNDDGAANNTQVIFANESVTESYFQEALSVPDVDIIVVLCHINPPQQSEFYQIYAAIRKVKKYAPLIMLSGHGHILFHENLDFNAMTIESGCYFETLGFIRFKLAPLFKEKQDSDALIRPPLKFKDLTYKWVDTSIDTFYELTGLNSSTFTTDAGVQVRNLIWQLYYSLNLNMTIGCMTGMIYSPYASFDASDSLYAMLLNQVMPSSLFNTGSGDSISVGIVNTHSLRYYLYPGVVILDDIYTIDPFNNSYFGIFDMQGNDFETLIQGIYNSTPAGWGPEYYWSSVEISDDQTYNLVFTQYDGTEISQIYQNTFGSPAPIEPYPSTLTETTIWIAYIQTFFPCI